MKEKNKIKCEYCSNLETKEKIWREMYSEIRIKNNDLEREIFELKSKINK